MSPSPMHNGSRKIILVVMSFESSNPANSFVMDKETYMRMVELMEKAETERSLATEQLAACKQQLRMLQATQGQQITEVGKLERAKRELSSENEELKKFCCLLDEAQQKSKQVALEWQNFGKYTAAVLKNEAETFECKLRVLQEQLDKQVRENVELQEMCLFLDKSHGEEGGCGEATPRNTEVSVHSICAPALNKSGRQPPQYMGVTSKSTLKDGHATHGKRYNWRNIQDPEAAVTELEKRVEKLETEKLELIKSLSAAHLLAASSSSITTPTPQQQHTKNTSASFTGLTGTSKVDSNLELPPDLYAFLRNSTSQQGTDPPSPSEDKDSCKQPTRVPSHDSSTVVGASPHNSSTVASPEVVVQAVTLLDVCRRLDAMEANGFPDSMEEAEVTALRVMVNIAWKRLQDQVKSSSSKH